MGERIKEMSTIEAAGKLLRLVSQSQPVTVAVTEPSPEVALVEAVRRGDREAFGQLYNMYASMVHGILLARVPYREVDDLVQDVFLVALRRLDTLRESAAFGGWLAMITRNRAIDFHRRSRETEELPEELPQQSHAEREAEAEAKRSLEAIRSLPEAYRETLVLRLVEGMTGPEIAARTNLTPASVRVNLHRGMKMLREKLGLEEQA
jgi:RNA polymerase sigma-70 factor (ECF subfamily)